MKIQDLFEPLSAKYCDYFYYLSVIFFVLTFMGALTILSSLIKGKNKMSIGDMAVVISQPLLLYFINRLYYSMCVGSLN